jgi:hypothetical protein
LLRQRRKSVAEEIKQPKNQFQSNHEKNYSHHHFGIIAIGVRANGKTCFTKFAIAHV